MNKKLLIIGILTVLTKATYAETIFVSLEKDNAVAVVNPISGTLLKTVPVGKRPRGIALSHDNKLLYVATSNDNTIKIFDSEFLTTRGVGKADRRSENASLIDICSLPKPS